MTIVVDYQNKIEQENSYICSKVFIENGGCLEYDGRHPFCREEKGCRKPRGNLKIKSSKSVENLAVIGGVE